MYGIYDGGVIARFAAPITVRSNQPIFASDTLALTRKMVKRAAQRWEITADLEPLSTGADDLFVVLVSNGMTSPVQVVMPQNAAAVKRRTATTVNVPCTQLTVGSSTISVPSTLDGLVPKGSFIKFSNHDKVYVTLSDRNGPGGFNIYPSLRVAVDSTQGHTFKWADDVIANFFFDLDSVQGMTYSDGVLMDMGTVTLVEALT